ncbi:P1 family peptidase [Kordiimonas marina]|uniref:DmpA family aminopeptidase n=1 Tax=Kordiimonas marina TaxID=2872312 RepID=UPI001FF44B99|nr:P1 family peptidase [Kordiimonas marina]MCJ9430650.1 P1 family peptidase [Kordiimonas marina]
MKLRAPFLALLAGVLMTTTATADATPRARDLGIPFMGMPGPLNAITDVGGVTVGQVTLKQDLAGGKAVRTGVTAVLPRGARTKDIPVFGASFALNGNGEMTGTQWIDESGFIEGPILLTNTHSVGVVRDAAIKWRVMQGGADSSGYWWSLPVVAETWDGELNDINGFHVKPEHVFEAIRAAKGGPVAEGGVGGGTGMICHEFKGGIGTASRVVKVRDKSYTVGVLVQANYGVRETLTIAGIPVGQELTDDMIYHKPGGPNGDTGSIIILVATDAPLLPHQLKRMAKRAGMGLARVGSYAGNGSGDIFAAFSTANANAGQDGAPMTVTMLANDDMDPLFLGTVEATEEAIVNALIAGRDMQGNMGSYVKGIPQAKLLAILKKHGRLLPAKK